jgi:hypothetical protein
MGIRDDHGQTVHATFHERLQELSPVHLGLAQGYRHTRQFPLAFVHYSHSNQYSTRHDGVRLPDVFMPGVEHEVLVSTQRPVSPDADFLVKFPCGIADP